jgi:hypothetical protein
LVIISSLASKCQHFKLKGLQFHLKPSQNKKGRKIFQLHRFLNTFSQLPAVKKYSKNSAAGNFFSPSYFDPALVKWLKIGHFNFKVLAFWSR